VIRAAAAALLAVLSAAPPVSARPAPSAPPARAGVDPAGMRAAIDGIAGGSPLYLARTGICVLSLETGEVLYARDPDALLNPASNVKLFTAAAALLRLGPEFRFETEVWTAPGAEAGAVRSLTIRGKGDPSLTTERLWGLAGEIQHRGVRVVQGDLRIDESYFDGEREAPGYDQERGDRAYLAPAGAVSLNANTLAIHVGPGPRAGARGRVEVEPASDFVEVLNRTATVKATGRRRIVSHTQQAGPQEQVVVEGRIPLGGREAVAYRKVDEPALYFGHTLKRLLELRGVKVTGKVRRK
jgi:D-alanyl-D-alanine carboxypeptidase/D-alanyl-D-alanine-endopeptidase (penicillin-binding protein 4)